jgi:hypothetical protein
MFGCSGNNGCDCDSIVSFASYRLDGCGWYTRFSREKLIETASPLDSWIITRCIENISITDDVVGDDQTASVGQLGVSP